MGYYDGTKLLNLLDLNKQKPEIFISTSNRSAGKTTFYGKKVVSDFIKKSKKFGLLYRYSYETENVADKFFNDLRSLFFPEYNMKQYTREKGSYVELTLTKEGEDEICCGYAFALNKADAIKKCSHLLNDIEVILFDEFQPESGEYAPKEVIKFQSIHTSLARGHGQQVKYLPVIMISNFVSLLNPYYTALGITKRLKNDTNYLRGEGWVLEQGFNADASTAQKQSAFNRAFNSDYTSFSSEKFYLNDNYSLVEKMQGKNTYVFTFYYDKKAYSVRYFSDKGLLYASKVVDNGYPRKYAADTDSMTDETILFSANPFCQSLRNRFKEGAFRFADIESKQALLALIAYR